MDIIVEKLSFPEGPVALEDGSVLVVDLKEGTLVRCHEGRTEIVSRHEGSPNGAAMGPDGRVYVCNNGGVKFGLRNGQWVSTGNEPTTGWIEAVDLKTGAVEVLYRGCGEETLRGPNDLVFDAHGGFYFSDPGKIDGRMLDRGSVYYAKADGSFIRRVIFPMLTPNGVGLSPDEKTLYVAETLTARVWAFEVGSPGRITKQRREDVFHGGRLVAGSAEYVRYDSLAVTASGKIVVGTLTQGGITEVWPDGSATRFHPLPDHKVTNICFGGADMQAAYITLSGRGALAELRWHEPGLKLNYQDLPAA